MDEGESKEEGRGRIVRAVVSGFVLLLDLPVLCFLGEVMWLTFGRDE